MDLEKAYRWARAKLDEHGLQNWDVMFDTARVRFGCCWHGKKLITLSKFLVELNNETEVHDTILHEIAHALVHDGHSQKWKQKALEIGCNGKRCYGGSVKQLPPEYSAVCSECGKVYEQYRKVSAHRDSLCRPCFYKGKHVRLHFVKRTLQTGLTKAIAS